MTVALRRPLVALSPHLDDAVLGCGRLLARQRRALVLTLFAGRPRAGAGARVTDWDAACGFGPGDDVVGERRREDRDALRWLAARPCWLGFVDSQYGGIDAPERLAEALAAALERRGARTLVAPLGVHHSDHLRAREAALVATRRLPRVDLLLYADALYALERRTRAVLRELGARGLELRECRPLLGPLESKRLAVRRYRSQLRALDRSGALRSGCALSRERYWEVRRP